MVELIKIAAPDPASPVEGMAEMGMAEMGMAVMEALERGSVLLISDPPFALADAERALIATGFGAGTGAGAAKNISYDADTCGLKGTAADGPGREVLTGLMARYARFAEALVRELAPGYGAGLTLGRTSFRPTEIEDRETSWRKDDRRRHIDAFPSTPTGGARILRVFMNVDQAGQPRCWRAGPDFEAYATAFLPKVARPLPGAASVMAALGITKSRRTGYDQLMLGLHDAAKRDTVWQETAPAREMQFEPGQVWMCFTDQIPHAAISGRNALEQSFYIGPDVLVSPGQSPLAILSRLTGRKLDRPLI
jgi:hypothetical protein